MPWLTEEPDFESEDGPRALSGILQEQWDRWWCCRKSQWISRGLGDSEAGERAFCEADKSRAMEGEVRWASSPRFNNFSQTRWRLFMPRERLRPLGDDTFATYSNDVRIRVAPYLFKKPMQLKKDPQKQTAWTNWLEYLSYELRFGVLDSRCRCPRIKVPKINQEAGRRIAFAGARVRAFSVRISFRSSGFSTGFPTR